MTPDCRDQSCGDRRRLSAKLGCTACALSEQGTKDAAGWDGAVPREPGVVGRGTGGRESTPRPEGMMRHVKKEGSLCAAGAENCGERPGHPTSSPALSPGSISRENLKVQMQMPASGGILN